MKRTVIAAVALGTLGVAAGVAVGQDDPAGSALGAVTEAPVTRAEFEALALLANNVWMLVAAAMVFIMHLGFAMLESGLTQAKNTVNILFKNTAIIAIGLLTYASCGFSLMYPGEEFAGAWFGFGGLRDRR